MRDVTKNADFGYQDLKVWELGMEISVEVYSLTAEFPTGERFGLISQMRRCAVSIPANIAEGHGRATTKEFVRFIAIAVGSAKELETFLLLSKRLNFGAAKNVDAAIQSVDSLCRMLRGLQRSLRQRLKNKS